MFKKITVSLMSAVLLLSSIQADAGSLGSRSTSSTSSRSSVSNSPSRSSSYQSNSQATQSSGGISKNSSIGMTRSDVSNRVKNGTNSAPANETTVAGKNPGGSNTSNNNYGNSNNNYSTTPRNNYSNSQVVPSQGHSTGALLGAAAAGAVGGYMLNGLMHNRDGSVYNGNGYNNGVPVSGYNNGNVNNGNGGYNNGMVSSPSNNGTSFWWSLLGFLLVMVLLYAAFAYFFGSKKNSNEGVVMEDKKSPEAMLRDGKEQMFINFQKNNKPSGVSYIQSNSDSVFFEAIRDDVVNSSETRTVSVRSLEAKLEDITEEGSRFIGSVSYKGVIVEREEGQEPVNTEINEMWNFIYNNGSWKLAGIEQL